MLDRYNNCLISLFKRVHELKSDRVGKRLLALEIQEELIVRIGRAESRIRKARNANNYIKFTLSQRGNTREFSSKLKSMYQQGMNYINKQRILITTLRSVGDALAFIYRDRHELKQFVRTEDAGFITGKRGARLERAILRLAFKYGATVVMNDLTNTLRHGDITIFGPDLWPDGDSSVRLIEAKSGQGGNKQRAERQQQAVKEIMTYIHTDQKETEKGLHVRIEARERSEHHFDAITRLLKNLPAKGWDSAEVEPGLRYVVIGCNAGDAILQAFEFVKGGARDWLIIDANSFKKALLGYYPFPLCIRDAECLFSFYNGNFVINVAVDITHINQVIADHNIRVELIDDAWKIIFLEVDKDWGERYVMPRAVGRFAGEFLSLSWFIDNILLGNVTPVSRIFQEAAARTQQTLYHAHNQTPFPSRKVTLKRWFECEHATEVLFPERLPSKGGMGHDIVV